MTNSQCYIGTPNGIVLCIDRKEDSDLYGRFWHAYREDAVEFTRIYQFVKEADKFFDDIRFPHPATNVRTFGTETALGRRQEKTRVMADEKLLEKRGDLGTFIVRVQHRQNSSWQGRLTWIEEDKTVYFRSIWEMIKLVESALDTVDSDEAVEEISWSRK